MTSNVRQTVVALCALASLVAIGAIGAVAAQAAPKGNYVVFTQCPRFTKGVNRCLYSETTSGTTTIGKQTVPITNKIILQGGIVRNAETEVETFVGALNGQTLTKAPQNVPGGLLNLVNCKEISEFFERVACELVFEEGLTGVNATAELAQPASAIGISKNNLVNEEGVALSLPVRIHLENTFLGSECYVGSSSKPLNWALTTGTTSPPAPNKPISGKVGEILEKNEGEILEIVHNELVNNSFSAPEATGCGGLFSFLIDPIIDLKLGLPAAAGKNTVILKNKIEYTDASSVIESE